MNEELDKRIIGEKDQFLNGILPDFRELVDSSHAHHSLYRE
jgi:hypothetical protein